MDREIKHRKDNQATMEAGITIGRLRGQSEEALKSLMRRFTPAELQEVINMVWFSPELQSIRRRLGELERKVNEHG